MFETVSEYEVTGRIFIYIDGCTKPKTMWRLMPNDGYLYWHGYLDPSLPTWVDDVVVGERSRRQGLGTILVRKAEERMKEFGVTNIEGIATREGALLWQSLGYTIDEQYNLSKTLGKEVRMSKKPQFPHVPGRKEPLFPHIPKGRLEQLPQTREAEKLKHFWVEENVPYHTYAIVEAWAGGTVRSPFNRKEEAIAHERTIAQDFGWNMKLVPSPQEKYPRQSEALKKLYPYEFVEYHDDGDLTIQILVPLPKPKIGFKKGDLMVITTDGHTFRESDRITPATINLLAKTEGDPIRKFCCRVCGECAPPELLEEGKFPERIAWLRRHYMEKHPGVWGKRLPMTVEYGEPVPPQYRDLISPTGPLPKDVI